MSTRGVKGFYRDGITKVMFNHWDSYPNLGLILLKQLKELENKFGKEKIINKLNDVFDSITLLKKLKDKDYNNRVLNFLYGDNLNGGLAPYFNKEIKIMKDDFSFMFDSVWFEWGWIINLDDNVFEAWTSLEDFPKLYWKGLKDSENDLRYNYKKLKIKYVNDNKLNNPTLVMKFKLNDLPSIKKFQQIMDNPFHLSKRKVQKQPLLMWVSKKLISWHLIIRNVPPLKSKKGLSQCHSLIYYRS